MKLLRSKIFNAVWMLPLATVACLAGQKPLVEWSFRRPGDLQGWQPNADLAEVAVTNSALSCRGVGVDPILEYRPSLDLKASPWQVVEITLRADRNGTGELFWSNTTTGRYGGFTQEKSTRFAVRGDHDWHTYHLLPFWHREGRIVRLRFDPYDGARFDLACIRVVELEARPASDRAEFNLPQDLAGWQWFESVGERETAPPAVRFPLARCGTGLLLGPPLRLNAASNTFASIRLSVDRGHDATLFFATDRSSGLHSRSFRLMADRREHTYNLDMLAAPDWQGTVLALGLQPSDAAGATATEVRLKLGDAPAGPPQLRVVSFALEDALPRAGSPAALTAIVSNTGGETATNLEAALELPVGLELAGPSANAPTVAHLGFDEETTLAWKVQSKEPLAGQARLRLAAANAEPVTVTAPCRFSARLALPPGGYVPEPKPVRGPFEVGVYYFPGWKTASQWEPLHRFPERKPVLGWYREGEPEVADWHIKWAVEHGITFFAYDWYWSQGARQLEHALHDGYFKARYRHLLKFCLLWANHNPPRTSSPEDCLRVTQYWLENYFRRPEHLLFDGTPVVFIFAPDRLTEDLGSERVKGAFAAMREECRRAGLKGLYLVACVGDAGGARRAAEEGYDAISAYNWPGLGLTGGGLQGPYETLVEGYRRQWEHLLEQSRLPLAPLPVSGGWDSRPWHGEDNLVRFGRTPELFKRHLLEARRLLESGRLQPASPKAILVEAWNEWGEGSYIEPHAEFGFDYLDAIRETFAGAPTPHDDVTPADAGLGPYDVPDAEPSRMAWEFARLGDAWNNTMQLADLKTADGCLSARTTGDDPAFFGPPIRVRASDFAAVALRMRLSRADGGTGADLGQVFWRTTRLAESESSSTTFPVQLDGQWHEYRVPVAGNSRWRGTITRLRLDPATQPGLKVELAWLRLSR